MTGRRRRPAPTWEEIADAIEVALDGSLIELTIRRDGHPAELDALARCLDRAGLIDWSGIRTTGRPGMPCAAPPAPPRP